MARRTVNPEGPEDATPYPDEKSTRGQGEGTWGENMYSQGGQSNRGSTRLPWPETVDADGWETERSAIRRNMARGGGRY